MPIVSLLLRQWGKLVEKHGCKPRSLADDLLILATGNGHARKLSEALDATFGLLSAMGGKVAPKKSLVFSTCAQTRKWLKRKFWKPVQGGIRVANHFRDLGTHLNLTFVGCGKTVNDRIWWAVKVVKAIARLPLTCAEKAKLIRATPLAAAKYGTPAAHVGTASACALRTAVVDAIGPKTTKRCPCRTLEFNSHGDDLDPEIVFGIEKFIISRRVLAKDPTLISVVRDILDAYADLGVVGIWSADTNLDELKAAPPPVHAERHLWESSDPELGPIGMLLTTVHKMGAAMDTQNFDIHKRGEVSTAFLDIPYNHVKKAIANHLTRARSRAAQTQRTLNQDMEETDIAVFKLAFRRVMGEARKIVSYLTAGGALSRDKLFDMGLAKTKQCPFCSCSIQTIDHTLHYCNHPELVKARAWQEEDPININSIPPDMFPEELRLGIPIAMDQTITGTYRGTPLEEVKGRTNLDRKAMGIRDHGDVTKMQRELSEVIQRMEAEHLNARQVAVRMRGVVCV